MVFFPPKNEIIQVTIKILLYTMDAIIYELAKGRIKVAAIQNPYISKICKALLHWMQVNPHETVDAAIIIQKILDRLEEPHDSIDSPRYTREFIMKTVTYGELQIVVDAINNYA